MENEIVKLRPIFTDDCKFIAMERVCQNCGNYLKSRKYKFLDTFYCSNDCMEIDKKKHGYNIQT